MVTGILLALLASLIYGFLGVAFEGAAKRGYATWDFIFWKQLIGTGLIFAAVIALGGPLLDLAMLQLAAIGAVSYVLTCVCYLNASRERDIAVNWTILNLSVLVPLAVSVLWFHDPFTGLKAVGALIILVAIVVLGGKANLGGRSHASRWALFILGAFLLNGVFSVLFRWVPADRSFLFMAYFYAVSTALALPLKLAFRQPGTPTKGLIPWATAGAASHCAGALLTMAALAAIAKVRADPGVIVYPITNGFVIPLGVVLGAIILHQTIDPRRKLGVAIGVAGLVLLSLP